MLMLVVVMMAVKRKAGVKRKPGALVMMVMVMMVIVMMVMVMMVIIGKP